METLTKYFQRSTTSPPKTAPEKKRLILLRRTKRSSLAFQVDEEESKELNTCFLPEERNKKRKTVNASFQNENENIGLPLRESTSEGDNDVISTVRTFSAVVITDCASYIDSKNMNEPLKNKQSTEAADSSGSGMVKVREEKRRNSLFNYFKRSEKVAKNDNRKIEDSPVNCLKQVEVVAQIHSPPRARLKSTREDLKKNLIPSLKIIRADIVKSFNFDNITVIQTNESNDEKFKWKTEKNIQRTEGSNSNANVFAHLKRLRNSSRIHDSERCDLDKITVFNAKCNISGAHESGKVNSKVSLDTLKKKDGKIQESFSLDNLSNDEELNDEFTSPSSNLYSKCLNDRDIKKCIQPWKLRVQFASGAKISPTRKKFTSRKIREAQIEDRTKVSEDDDASMKKVSNASLKGIKQIVETDGRADVNVNNLQISLVRVDCKNVEIGDKPRQLAPLFSKQYEKKKLTQPNMNEEAQRKFFDCGLPSVVVKKLDQKNSIDKEYRMQYTFPKINHVQQRNDSFVWSLSDVNNLNLKSPAEKEIVTKSLTISQIIKKEVESFTSIEEVTKFDFKTEVALLKKLEPDVNVSVICSSVKRLNRNAEGTQNICWTDKYKPTILEDVIGNTNSLLKLQEWIESQKRYKVKTRDNDSCSSSDEFIDSDDSNNSVSNRNNIAILVGPSGCGKTCTVYMLASELGFEVMEVNAASNRNGKRLLDELLEATQSHRVKRTSIFNKFENKSKKKKKEKKTRSLFLIEEADILFEKYDEGFLSALNSLVSQSKRPFIFVVNDINYPHLAKYNNARNLILKFTYPSRALINVWLQLIALVEGVRLSDNMLIDLYHIAGSDLRRNLLQLQMLITSRLWSPKLNGEQLFYCEWWKKIIFFKKDGDQKLIPEAREKKNDLYSPEKRKFASEVTGVPLLKKFNDTECKVNQKLLNDRRTLLENVAFIGYFENNDEILLQTNIHKFTAEENYHICHLNDEICSFLKRKVFSEFTNKSRFLFGECNSLSNQNNKIKSVYQNTISNLKPVSNDYFSKYCDYLPTIRGISRIEQDKATGQFRKTSRYFSYLRSVNIYINDEEVELLRKSLV